MGYRISPLLYRANKYRLWNSFWYSKQNYATVMFEDLSLRFVLKSLSYHTSIAISNLYLFRYVNKLSKVFFESRINLNEKELDKLTVTELTELSKSVVEFSRNKSRLVTDVLLSRNKKLVSRANGFIFNNLNFKRVIFYRQTSSYFISNIVSFNYNFYNMLVYKRKNVKFNIVLHASKINFFFFFKNFFLFARNLAMINFFNYLKTFLVFGKRNVSRVLINKKFKLIDPYFRFYPFKTLSSKLLKTSNVHIYPMLATKQESIFHFELLVTNAAFLADYIAYELEYKIPLNEVLQDVLGWARSTKFVKGLRISCTGRFKGEDRSHTITRTIGYIPYGAVNQIVDFSVSHACIKYGLVGIKVWIHFSR